LGNSLLNGAFSSPTFVASYYAALEKLIFPYSSYLEQFYAQCNGMGGFSGDYKLQSVANDYSNALMDNLWVNRQVRNGLTNYQTEAQALLNGLGWDCWGDLYNSSMLEYGSKKRVVVVGHTHGAKIESFIAPHTGIFANSGTWIDQDLVNAQTGSSSFETATFICIDPADKSGSDVHTVSLYKYQSKNDILQLSTASVDASS